jgi:dTDP-4-dehydrorhamnose reductase
MIITFEESCKILMTGVTSIHGWPIFQKLRSIFPQSRLYGIRPPNMKIPDQPNVQSVCMTDKIDLLRIKEQFQPTHILHAAGVCDLDICETRPQYAHDINVTGAKNIANIFSTSYVMYLSADLVFSGHNPPQNGYKETDTPDPISVVGKTYLLAEQEITRCRHHAIVRIGLPMGDSIQGEKGAVDFIESRLKRGLPMSLFHDEWRSCVACDELADILLFLFSKKVQGLYHCGGPDAIRLYDIGKRILVKGNYKKEALKIWSRNDDISGPPRIGNVHLDSSVVESIIGRGIRPWVH